ncbi:MAG: oligosaccharide flippase family protein, partial [Abitibacteriaceae bacterium]|nr:oligosaccharide flippase family protein [Abditibacteriaceae bacterium]
FKGMALATLINPAVTLVLLVCFGKTLGVFALAAGFMIGPLLGCLPVLWSLRGSWQDDNIVNGLNGNGQQDTTLREVPHFSSVFMLALITTMQVQIPAIVGRILASGMGDGVIASVEYAGRFSWMPVTVLANSVGNALLPSLAEKHQTSENGLDAAALSNTTKAIRVLAYVLVPLAMVLACYAFPVISIALGGGKFDRNAAILTADMMTCCTPLIWIGPIWMILFKVIQARNALRVLLETLILGTVVDVVFMLCFKNVLGYRSIPLASSADCLMATAFALYRTHSSIALPLGEIMSSMATLTVIALIANLVVFIVRPVTPWLITGAVYGVVYLGLAWILKIREQREFWSLILGKGLKRFRAAAS